MLSRGEAAGRRARRGDRRLGQASAVRSGRASALRSQRSRTNAPYSARSAAGVPGAMPGPWAAAPQPRSASQGGVLDLGFGEVGHGVLRRRWRRAIAEVFGMASYPSPAGAALSATRAIVSSFLPISGSISFSGTWSASS